MNTPLHIALISGSHRPAGESGRIARHLAGHITASGHTPHLIDLAVAPAADIPFWDEGLWGAEGLSSKWAQHWQPYAAILKQADALVVISPEYAGMVPARLKNFMLMPSAAEIGHKPGLIVTVSSGIGGTYPVTELRGHVVKNSKLVWVPDHIIVRNAPKMLQENVAPEDAKFDSELRERITFSLDELYHYAAALKPLRESGKLLDKRFPFGM